MRAIDADRLKEHIDKLPALPDGNFAGNHSALKALINMQPSVEPEKCGDCISRQAVIDRINKLIEVEKKQGTDDWGYGQERVNAYESMLHMVESEYLYPSVEPERPRGKWIRVIDPDVNAWTGGHTCSECGRACVQMSMNYCANCGADMMGKQALKYADTDTALGGLQSAT